MPDRLSVAGLNSNGGVARRIIKAERHVIGWCSLANPLSSLCSERAAQTACRTATHHSASHSLRNPVGVSALLWESERASALTSLSVRRERQLRRVVLVLSCRILLKRNITDTLPHSQPCLYRTRLFVSFRRCSKPASFFLPGHLPAAMHALPAAP
jgi:hypothetical protein